MNTRAQLAELPGLAAELFVTIGHPNPGERSARGAARTELPVPADLTALDNLRTDSKGHLFALSQCVRTVLETMREHDYWDAPDASESPTWASECDWLLATADWWELDQWCSQYVPSEVHRVHAAMQQAVRTPKPHHLVCPECGDHATVETGWLRCFSGHERPVGSYGLQLLTREPTGTTALAAEFGITPERIRKWHERGRIKPVTSVGQAHLWSPWEIFSQLYPTLARELAKGMVKPVA